MVDAYRLYACVICNFVFIDPAIGSQLRSEALFDDGYFRGGGAGYTDYFSEADLLEEHGRRYGKLLVQAGARRILDVGAAAGFILRGLIAAGCSGMGIEPNHSMAAFAASSLGLDVRPTTLEDFEPGERFDGVALLQVIDHLDDIRRSFERVRELTVPGGWCLIEFGDRASLTARLLGSGWHEYAPPSVRRVFSLSALRRLLAEYGFALSAAGHPPKYLRADHAISLLRYKTGSRAPLARALLDTVAGAIPAGARLRYPGDDIAWALFHKGR